MPGSLQRSAATIAAILAGVVALALVNPFCCHLLPYYEGEAGPSERTIDEAKSPCPGKPEAVPSPAIAPLEFVAVCEVLPRPVTVPGSTRTPWSVKAGCDSWAGPPRHVRFGVFLI